jgi:4-amino-4-deoxy-L-arabinose transferase-like glycosyltransferase
LWLQALSAYFLGVSGFSVLLPELLAGTISVVLLYHLVRRSSGVLPGLLAALTLALTPIVIATDRNNTMDSTLILTLLLATWAFVKATETKKMRFLLLGAILVGIGFNIKMLQAYLPLPAFYGLYFLGSHETFWRKTGKLALTTALLLTISLSWAVIVDLTPEDQRPYVGSSTNNSELDLIVGYNGAQRLLGMFGRDGSNQPPQLAGAQNDGQLVPGVVLNGNSVPPNAGDGNRPPFPPSGDAMPPNGNPGGGMDIGQPGVLRLFIAPLNKEISWLLPFGLISVILLAAGSHWKWPITSKHRPLVLWGLWLITCVVFFSIAGFFHQYYLSMLGAPLAALVALGIGELWTLSKVKPILGVSILGISAVVTTAFQICTAVSFMQSIWWLPFILAVCALSLVVFGVYFGRKQKGGLLQSGFGLLIVGMLLTPGIWSVYTTLSATQNQSLPSSYSGEEIGPVAQRDLRIDQSLLDYLQSNTADMKYLMAVPSSMQGADYVLATGRPVLYVGGFNGQDQVVTAQDLAQLVSSGELRYVYWSEDGRGGDSNSEISTWVASSCAAVEGFETSIQNARAPDGTTIDPANSVPSDFGGPQVNMRATLYDCALTN